MKLYKYSFAEDCTASFETIEVREYSDFCVDQEDIGKALRGHRDTVVLLTEQDFEKARNIVLADMQRIILGKKEELAKLYDKYNKFCDLEVAQ